jgi:hypothetical protein
MTEPNIGLAAAKALGALYEPEVRKATVYLSDKLVVSVCRRAKLNRRSKRDDFVMKVGAPNYDERAFIVNCKKAGVPMPVRKVQIKFWPKKKAK